MGLKILWCGDSPTVNTGFGVVSKNVLNRLAAKGYDIEVLGINYFGEWFDQSQYPYRIHPCDKGDLEQMYGVRKLWWLLEKTMPDVLIIFNDPWIISSYFEAKPPKIRPYTKYIGYFPIDAGPLKPKWADVLNQLDAQICYSNFAERIVLDANNGKRPDKLYQVYHGVDTDVFYPIAQYAARATLGIPQDSFVVGMVARNQFRKRFDILMKAFAEFAADKPDAKLYLHTALKDQGFDIQDLARQLGLLDNKLILTEGITPASGVTDKELNLIYNTFDVNALISLGDGFGLPVAESMATGCPQVVSGHSCLEELVRGHGGLTVKTASWIMNTSSINTWGGVSDVKDLVDKLNLLYGHKELRLKYSEEGYKFITEPKFNWDFITDQFDAIIKESVHVLQ